MRDGRCSCLVSLGGRRGGEGRGEALVVRGPAMTLTSPSPPAHRKNSLQGVMHSGRSFFSDPPQPWVKGLSSLGKVLLTRVLQPLGFSRAVQELIKEQLGAACAQVPSFDLEAAYERSSNGTPLVFVVSNGINPVSSLMRYAEIRRRRLLHVVMGQDQGDAAERVLRGYLQQVKPRGVSAMR